MVSLGNIELDSERYRRAELNEKTNGKATVGLVDLDELDSGQYLTDAERERAEQDRLYDLAEEAFDTVSYNDLAKLEVRVFIRG
jgi:hypothetical protein